MILFFFLNNFYSLEIQYKNLKHNNYLIRLRSLMILKFLVFIIIYLIIRIKFYNDYPILRLFSLTFKKRFFKKPVF